MKEVYVMKTPWRFLADLISKRPAAEQVEDQTPRAEIKAIEYRPEQEEAVANPPTKEIRSEQASTEADAPRGVEADAAEYVSLESGQAQVDDVRSVSGEGQEGAVVAEASKVPRLYPPTAASPVRLRVFPNESRNRRTEILRFSQRATNGKKPRLTPLRQMAHHLSRDLRSTRCLGWTMRSKIFASAWPKSLLRRTST
jgi:hypothetical protein